VQGNGKVFVSVLELGTAQLDLDGADITFGGSFRGHQTLRIIKIRENGDKIEVVFTWRG